MKTVVSVLGAALAMAGCSFAETKPAADQAAAAAPRPVASPLFLLRNPALKEVAGLALSRRNQGLFWTAPRLGEDSPVVEGVSFDGTTVTRLHITGMQKVEWADLAVGPGVDGRSTIFIGDIGDRAKIRPELTVYRFTEPLAQGSHDLEAGAELLGFRLEGGARDGGALLRDPLSNKLYVIAKEYGRDAPVFAGDAIAPAGSHAEMQQVAQLKLHTLGLETEESGVMAGDVSIDGTRIALRTASAVLEWERDRNENVEKALSRPPARVVAIRDLLASSLAYGPDASLMLALSGQVMRIEPMGQAEMRSVSERAGTLR